MCATMCYPFIYWWTSLLLSILAIVNSATMNFGVHVSLNYGFLIAQLVKNPPAVQETLV